MQFTQENNNLLKLICDYSLSNAIISFKKDL